MSAITTHVMDTAAGRPAKGMKVVLQVRNDDGSWSEAARGATDAEGRVKGLLPAEATLVAATYRLWFDSAEYFKAQGKETLYPEISIVFQVRPPIGQYHVPLLIAPFSYTVFRGR